jgi:CO dehydrogenase nickel-insertion accessory protein CooC1
VNARNLLGKTKDLAQIIIEDASKQALEQAEKIMLRLREIADDIEVELNKIDEKVARAETRKNSVRRKAA